MFSLSLRSEIRREEGCLDTAGWEGGKVSLTSCHGQGLNQKWTHNKVHYSIVIDEWKNCNIMCESGQKACGKVLCVNK